MDASSNARRIFPARAALCFPRARRLVVDENVNAAAGPRFPRNQASNGSASSSKRSHGRANVRALFVGHQSNSRKLSSLHETERFLQQQLAVGGGRFVARELDQVTSIQEIFEQLFFVFGERR